MTIVRDQDCLALATLAAVIAHSQIVVAKLEKPTARFPVGYDAVDVAILDWIAAEGRRAAHSFGRM